MKLKILLGALLVISLLIAIKRWLPGKDTRKEIIESDTRFYTNNKNTLREIMDLFRPYFDKGDSVSEIILDNYRTDTFVQVTVYFHHLDGDDYTYQTFDLSHKNVIKCEIDTDAILDIYPGKTKIYNVIMNDGRILQCLSVFKKLKARSLKAGNKGIFVSLGDALWRNVHSINMSGILLLHNQDKSDTDTEKSIKLDTNAFITDEHYR